MKIIHTGDLHLCSPLTSRLSAEKAKKRGREIEESFAALCERGYELGASAFIIAGDLFDSERISARSLETVLAVIARHSGMDFFYLAGNHEGNALKERAKVLPANLKLFGGGWTYYDLDGVRISGRRETASDMFSALELGKEKNIVILHGELRDKTREGGIIGLSDFDKLNIDYMALGHYHTYSVRQFGRGAAVYAGTPEGRGFDETGEKGFCLIDTDGERVTHRFIPSAKRKLLIEEIDISDAETTADIWGLIEKRISGIGRENILRVLLTGRRKPELIINRDIISSEYGRVFFYFEIKDETKLAVCPDDYRFDKSLKGEFIRLCFAEESLSEEERDKIIECGIAALSGEAYDE